MHVIDAFLILAVCFLFAGIVTLSRRKYGNGHHEAGPELTLKRQLERCLQALEDVRFELRNEKQKAEVYMALAESRKEIIKRLTDELGGNHV